MNVERQTHDEPNLLLLAQQNYELREEVSKRPGDVVREISEKRAAAQREAVALARSEMARRRRRLGHLTPLQELRIENLLISTVTRISELIVDTLESPHNLPNLLSTL